MVAVSLPALQIWKLVFPACVTDGPRPTVVKNRNFESIVLAFRNSIETHCCFLITAEMTSKPRQRAATSSWKADSY